MRDGFTRKLEARGCDPRFEEWLASWRAMVVVLSGEHAGTELEVEASVTTLGRSPEEGWSFADDTMSREHAALEFASGGLRLRDLGSRNGTRVNGSDVRAADLKSGDRFALGEHEFQIVIEPRPRRPRTYVVEDD